MAANILILDIGNTQTKCYVFHVQRTLHAPDGKLQATALYEEHQRTTRGHPWDLVDTTRNMLLRAINAHHPDYGMITAFGDAFVHYDPKANRRPRFVFADEPVSADLHYDLDSDYQTVGFPTGQIEITGVRALRAKHQAEWLNILPVNTALGREIGGNSKWRAWDITQASATGEYNLKAREWFHKDGIPTCQPSDEIGMFQNMPLLAGGLDNSFLDTTEQTPYIVAGTWLVTSTIHDDFQTPTETQRQHGGPMVDFGKRSVPRPDGPTLRTPFDGYACPRHPRRFSSHGPSER